MSDRASSERNETTGRELRSQPPPAGPVSAVVEAGRSPAPRATVASPKVLMLRPPQLFYFGVWPRGPRLSVPTGLLAIASYLKAKGVDVSIFDAFVEDPLFDRDQDHDPDASLVQRWMRHFEDGSVTGGDLAGSDRHLRHFGADWARIRAHLLDTRPDVVGITNLFRENTEETVAVARLIRETLPETAVVVGGPNATAQADEMLSRCDAIDVIGLGDGEQTMLEIVEWLQGRRALDDVAGIAFVRDGVVVRTRERPLAMDLDELGHLDYDLIRLDRYFAYERSGIMARNKFVYDGAERSVSLVTSRGCPYKCSFCSIHIHAGRKFRRYSVAHTLDHIERLVVRHGVRHLHFEDDNLTLDRARFMELMEGVLARNLRFTWDTPNGVFANTLDEEMLRLMKRTGCIYLVIGVESGDQWVLDNVIRKQPLTLEHVRRAFALGKRVGLDMQAFYIIGFPAETMQHIRTTLDFAMKALREYDVLPHMAIARADPGTDLYREAQEIGALRTDHSLANAGGVHIDYFVRHLVETEHFRPEDLEALNERFHRRAIAHVAAKTLGYLLRHPVQIWRSLRFLAAGKGEVGSLREVFVKLFFCRLFYRHALLREDDLAGIGGEPPRRASRGEIRARAASSR